MSELLFTGQVPIPDVAGSLDKTSQILQNYSALKAAEKKLKANEYKRLEARKNSVRNQIFGDSAIGKIPAPLRPAALQAIGVMANQAGEQMDIPGGIEFGQTLGRISGFIQDLIPPDLTSPRNEFVDNLGDPLVNQNSVLMYDYSEEALAAFDDTYNFTGVDARVDFDGAGNPTMMILTPGAQDYVPHSQTEGYMATAAYKPTPQMRAAISDQDLAERYLGAYMQEATSFNADKFRREFAQFFANEQGELNTADNISLESNEGSHFWKLTNEVSQLGSERGLQPLEPNQQAYVALSSGDPNHPVNQKEYKKLHQDAVRSITERVLPIARARFNRTAPIPSANTTRGKDYKKEFLTSVAEFPDAIPFEDENGNIRTLYGYGYTGSKVEGVDNIDVDNRKAALDWDEGLNDAIESARRAEKENNPAASQVQLELIDGAVTRRYTEANGDRPSDTPKLSKVQAMYKAWDPVAETFRMFVKGPSQDARTGETSQSTYYYLAPTGALKTSYDLVNSMLKKDLGFSGFMDDAIKGGKDYVPEEPVTTPTQGTGTMKDY